jgi:RimJ/RimL family protein N-acetyltransferase
MLRPLAVSNTLSFEGAICRDRGGALYGVRAYRPTDRAALQRFYEEFEPKRTAQGLPPEKPVRIREWLDRVLASGVHLVALRGDQIIGHGLVMPTPHDRVGEYAVFVHADFRGRGLGTELNRIAIEAARRAGYHRLWLTVEPGNRSAVRSYEKVGFRFVPRTVFSVEPEMELQL